VVATDRDRQAATVDRTAQLLTYLKERRKVEKLWQDVFQSAYPTTQWSEDSVGSHPLRLRGSQKFWMVLDGLTVLGAAIVATLFKLHTNPVIGVKGFWRGTLIHGRSMTILLALLCEFTFALIVTSRRLHLYTPRRLNNFLHEQRLSVEACFTSGLLLTGTLYLIHAADISRGIVLVTIGLVTISLSLRRIIYRALIYRQFQRGEGTRNVLIVGTGPAAQALRHHLDSIRRLGYTFKGFIDVPAAGSPMSASAGDVVGSFDTLFDHARKHFVDEIFLTNRCERGVIQGVLERAQAQGIDLRVVPDIYDGLAWSSPIEYVGQFPTIPLHRGHVPEIALHIKRTMDILLSGLALGLLAPILVAIAVAVKLDSHGPVFYLSDRIGKKGRVFRCMKFRTMVRDAEKRRADVMHMNERDGVLFKITNDPRITKLGRTLRKYSLDELPQLFNVFCGDMSIVGPRPPIASEVREYKLNHLRRLDVTPGITGLWQVQARQDPSFDNYISLDVTYIENWSIWLDVKIITRTIGVVLAGTGS
jgi:exopolysaccharide biosynthesis polyprenyl glycosylphosphotransferase